MLNHKWTIVAALVWLSVTASTCYGNSMEFGREVRSILSDACFRCHGPDEAERQADFRLDVESAFDPQEVLDRITSDDPDYVMPPPDSHKALTTKQIETLTSWLEQGAPFLAHWAFQPLRPVEVPAADIALGTPWTIHAIDRFSQRKMLTHGLRPRPSADRRTLIRRLSLDLTGLPPSQTEVQNYLDDASIDAYEKVVDRLLDSPHYGEHMARYWLDLVRFADTNGRHHDHYREMTPYRDWVIDAFNNNLSFDKFIVDQLAGDLQPDPTVNQRIASGFNRLHLIIDVGTALPEESFHRNVVDRVAAFGTTFLGLTLQCAECHDHKYDPVSQKEFYQLYAFFNNFDGQPETGGRNTLDFRRGLQEPYIELPTDKQREQLNQLRSRLESIEADIQSIDADHLSDQRRSRLQKEQERITKELDQLRQTIPATLVMKERSAIRPTNMMIRGAYDQPGESVWRDTPAFLPPLQSQQSTGTRLDLAHWLIEPDHPLTARVAVNRFWQQLFGVGLVKTSEDFGAQGETPSHPELLDYLALQFIQSGWDVKRLVREIVLSETYRQSSQADRGFYVTDPENRLLARGARYRLDGEVIRDQALRISGLLVPTLHGRSVKPPQPDGLWKTVAMPSSNPNCYAPDSGDKIFRRSLYTFWKRGMPPPQLTIFDAPTRETCIARRERTNTPLQALVLMNERQLFDVAVRTSANILAQPDLDERSRLELAYVTVTCQLPTHQHLNHLVAALGEFRRLFDADPENAQAIVSRNDARAGLKQPIEDTKEWATWTMLVHSLFNLDITKTRY